MYIEEMAASSVKYLAIAGCKYAGKSTVSKIAASVFLSRGHSVRFAAFGTPLKKAVQAMFGLSDAQVCGSREDKEAVDPRWDMSPRQLLQTVGTDLVRSSTIAPFGSDFWVRSLFASLDAEAVEAAEQWVVIDDLRYPEELAEVKRRGGKCWLVCRDQKDPWEVAKHQGVERHDSETALSGLPLDSWDLCILSTDSESIEAALTS